MDTQNFDFDFDDLGHQPMAVEETQTVTSRVDKAAIMQSSDQLEQALATLPLVRAPRQTLSRVLARIATLPQLELDAAALSIGLVPPRKIKYAPPLVAPLASESVTAEAGVVVGRAGQFNPLGYLFIGLWLSVCLLGLYLIWPGISNLIFGPPQTSDGLARLQALQGWWSNLSSNFGALFNTLQPYLPTLVSALAGIAIMLYIVNQQRRHLWTE